jgi:hypothetical protein
MKGIHNVIPSNPQELQPTRLIVEHSGTNIYYVSVINAENLRVSEWVIGARIVVVV